MADRRLDAEERAVWRRVAATVRPMHVRPKAVAEGPAPPLPDAIAPKAGARGRVPPIAPPPPAKPRTTPPADTLDGGWDRRLSKGNVAPDRSIDLHGHTLASAHAALEMAIGQAVADDARVLLIVTGRPPRPGVPGRGLIRGAIGDWLATSAWSARIAAVRNAHPRHGGAGALYVILRRRR